VPTPTQKLLVIVAAMATFGCQKSDPTDTANCAAPPCGIWDDSASPTDSADTGPATQAWAAIVINEFMASNSSTTQDKSGAFPDWLELYNPTGETVDLDAWSMTDDFDIPDKHALEELEIDAGGYLVLYADGDTSEGSDHLSFKLSKSGESIGLYAPDGTAMDRLEYGQQVADLSAARVPDGGNIWEITNQPTPGESNRSSD
jgi:hypothetical protein